MGERLTELLSTSLLLLLLVCHLGGVFSIVNFEVSGFGLAGRCVDVLVTRTAWGGRLVLATIGRTANRNTQKYRNTEIQKYSKVVYHIYNVVIGWMGHYHEHDYHCHHDHHHDHHCHHDHHGLFGYY